MFFSPASLMGFGLGGSSSKKKDEVDYNTAVSEEEIAKKREEDLEWSIKEEKVRAILAKELWWFISSLFLLAPIVLSLTYFAAVYIFKLGEVGIYLSLGAISLLLIKRLGYILRMNLGFFMLFSLLYGAIGFMWYVSPDIGMTFSVLTPSIVYLLLYLYRDDQEEIW